MCAEGWARVSVGIFGKIDLSFWSYEDGSLELLAAILSP